MGMTPRVLARASMRPSRSLLPNGALGSSPKGAPALPQRACLATSSQQLSKNRVYSSVRNEDQFRTYLAASSSSRRPLLTLWTANFAQIAPGSPLIKSLVESGVGEAEGGVGYCEVEFDAPDVISAGLGLTYMISSVPTLLSFDAGEAQVETKIADGSRLKDRRFLEEWIRTEARRHGGRGGGGGGGGGGRGSLFGGLFGSFKS